MRSTAVLTFSMLVASLCVLTTAASSFASASVEVPAVSSPIPEPVTAGLLLAGAVGWRLYRRRR